MMEDYESLVDDLKALDGCPFAENGWQTRPKSDSWGVIAIDPEVDTLNGDNLKQARAFEGTIDLFSKRKSGDGYVEDIEEILNTLSAKTDTDIPKPLTAPLSLPVRFTETIAPAGMPDLVFRV